MTNSPQYSLLNTIDRLTMLTGQKPSKNSVLEDYPIQDDQRIIAPWLLKLHYLSVIKISKPDGLVELTGKSHDGLPQDAKIFIDDWNRRRGLVDMNFRPYT